MKEQETDEEDKKERNEFHSFSRGKKPNARLTNRPTDGRTNRKTKVPPERKKKQTDD